MQKQKTLRVKKFILDEKIKTKKLANKSDI